MIEKHIRKLLNLVEEKSTGTTQLNESSVVEGMPSSVAKHKQDLANMSPEDFAKKFEDKSDEELISMAWRHGYGKGSKKYVEKRNKGKQPISENADLSTYKSRLNDLLKAKRAHYLELKQQGLSDDKAFMAAEKEYGAGYKQLLSDMPEAHKEYVSAQNSELWSGNTWERDPQSGRSAVDEGRVDYNDPDPKAVVVSNDGEKLVAKLITGTAKGDLVGWGDTLSDYTIKPDTIRKYKKGDTIDLIITSRGYYAPKPSRPAMWPESKSLIIQGIAKALNENSEMEKGTPDVDQILEHLSGAYRSMRNYAHEYGNFGLIEDIYKALRMPLMKDDFEGFMRVYRDVLKHYPDSSVELLDEMMIHAGLDHDATIDDFFAKVTEQPLAEGYWDDIGQAVLDFKDKELPLSSKKLNISSPSPHYKLHPEEFKKDVWDQLKDKGIPVAKRPAPVKKAGGVGLTPELLTQVWRKLENVVSNVVPDGDPIDWMAPYVRKLGIDPYHTREVLDLAVKRHYDKRSDYSKYLEDMWDAYGEATGQDDYQNPWK